MTDAFAIQDEISAAIADQLKVRLTGRRRSITHPEAYQAYLEGKHHVYEATTAGMAKSLECYERSIALDPNYAAPWAALGQRAFSQAWYLGARPRSVIPAGLTAVSRALELDSEAAEARCRVRVNCPCSRRWRRGRRASIATLSSVGHWEGDTLVVDTTNFNGLTRLDTDGHPQSDKLHLIERFTRTDAGHIAYDVTVDDPKIYTRPWKNTRVFILRTDGEIQEYSCEENNKGLIEGRIKVPTYGEAGKK